MKHAVILCAMALVLPVSGWAETCDRPVAQAQTAKAAFWHALADHTGLLMDWAAS